MAERKVQELLASPNLLNDKQAFSIWIAALTDDILRNEISEIKPDPSKEMQHQIIPSDGVGLSENGNYCKGSSAELCKRRHHSIEETFVDKGLKNHFSVGDILDKTTAHSVSTNSRSKFSETNSEDDVAAKGEISESTVSRGTSEGGLRPSDMQSRKVLMVEESSLPELVINDDISSTEVACITNGHDAAHHGTESTSPTVSQMGPWMASSHPIIADPYQRKVLLECASDGAVNVSGSWSSAARQHEDYTDQLEREPERRFRAPIRSTADSVEALTCADIVTSYSVALDRKPLQGMQRSANEGLTQNAFREVAAKGSIPRNVPRNVPPNRGEHEGSVDLSSLTFQVR